MKLKIVDFIKTHSNWEELLTSPPYNLTIKRDGNLILFKYNQIKSNFSEEICREARGLILEENTWRVVRMAFKKFFNIDEVYADAIDWDTAVASEKIDGSIISVFYYANKWRIATNSTIDAFKAEIGGISPFKTFGELFESVLPLSTFKGNRYENLCFTFELTSPYTQVVIAYPETKVHLLSVRYMNTLEEVAYDVLPMYGSMLNVDLPKYYYMNDEQGFRNIVEKMGEGHEGIVVRDAAGNRVKIKTLLYFNLHRMRNNGQLTVERIVDLIRMNDHEEYLSYFPSDRPYFDKVRKDMGKALEAVINIRNYVEIWMQENPNAPRKWFAQEFGTAKYAPLYFAAYDYKLNEFLNKMSTDKYVKFFGIGKELN